MTTDDSHKLGAAAAQQGIPLEYKANDFLIYHWSPSSRRRGIARYGLVPGKMSVERIWKPPYVCLSPSPSLAWSLSGMRTDYDNSLPGVGFMDGLGWDNRGYGDVALR